MLQRKDLFVMNVASLLVLMSNMWKLISLLKRMVNHTLMIRSLGLCGFIRVVGVFICLTNIRFKRGLEDDIPICCIFAYLAGARASVNGVFVRGLGDAWVPCWFHHKYAINHKEYEGLLNKHE